MTSMRSVSILTHGTSLIYVEFQIKVNIQNIMHVEAILSLLKNDLDQTD